MNEAATNPATDWPHLLVNGSDAEFRRVLHGLAALTRRLDLIHDYAARPHGLTGNELAFLLAVAETSPRSLLGELTTVAMGGLTRRLGINHPTASRLSGKLVRRGLLEKRPDPMNARFRRLALTDAGHAVAEQAGAILRHAHNLAFAAIRPRDFTALKRLAATLDEGSAVAVETLAR